jgi:tetratricopeptide (TPR) repeat protein
VAALLLVLRGSAAGEPQPTSTAQEELQAAKLLQTALFARGAGADEWRKLDAIYADLAGRNPRNVEVLNAHAEFLWSIGERVRAAEMWQAVLAIDPNNDVVLAHLGGALLAAGKPREALEHYERASKSKPDNALHHFTVANVSFLFRHELGVPEEVTFQRALFHFAEATRLAPQNVDFARAYAETFYLLPTPDWRVALVAWENYHAITPKKDFALANLARVHMKLGEKAAARDYLARIQSPEFARLKARLGERLEAE